MTKTVERGRKSSRKTTATRKVAAPARTAKSKRKSTGKGPAPRPLTRERQAALYDQGMRLFTAGEFAKAADILAMVATGPNREMAHAARTHRTVCERRLSASPEPRLTTPDEHYDYAIALINRRELEGARRHLLEALKHLKDGDHVHYALALCYALEGQMENAAAHLKRAIDLRPANRAAARHDPDFEPFTHAPEISAILLTGKG